MFVIKNIEVHENMSTVVFNENKTYFSTHMEDTRPGFTCLSLEYTSDESILQKCFNVSGNLYLSNVLF